MNNHKEVIAKANGEGTKRVKVVRLNNLRQKDYGRLKELMDVFVKRQGRRRITTRNIKRAMSCPEHTLVAAFDKANEIVGVTALIEMNIFTARVGLVEEVSVHENYRGRGVATRILQEVIHIARKKKIDYLKLNTNIKNPSNGLYRKLGFTQKEDNVYQMRF